MDEINKLKDKVNKLELLTIANASMHSALLDLLKEKGTITMEDLAVKAEQVKKELLEACPNQVEETLH